MEIGYASFKQYIKFIQAYKGVVYILYLSFIRVPMENALPISYTAFVYLCMCKNFKEPYYRHAKKS